MEYFGEQPRKKTYDRKTAKAKAEHFCAYQERSQQQVRDKLYDYGLHAEDVEEIISELITENFINEERFARAFIGGKFRSKKWGKRKILQQLYPHNLSKYCIQKGMEEIEEDDYRQTLQEQAEKKRQQIKDRSSYIVQGKLKQYLIGRGFEPELVNAVVAEMIEKDPWWMTKTTIKTLNL